MLSNSFDCIEFKAEYWERNRWIAKVINPLFSQFEEEFAIRGSFFHVRHTFEMDIYFLSIWLGRNCPESQKVPFWTLPGILSTLRFLSQCFALNPMQFKDFWQHISSFCAKCSQKPSNVLVFKAKEIRRIPNGAEIDPFAPAPDSVFSDSQNNSSDSLSHFLL